MQGAAARVVTGATPSRATATAGARDLLSAPADEGAPWAGFGAGAKGIAPGAGRRVLDVLVATVGLLLLGVPMLLVALAVRVDSAGPALFRQTRIGQGGRPFTIYKFRTMRTGSAGSMLTSITRFGRFLRRTHVDELPQLLHVLSGRMTLVGSRPQTPSLARRYSAESALVFQYRPGLTGPGVLGLNDDDVLPPAAVGDDAIEDFYITSIVPQRVALDLEYVQRPTPGATSLVLLRTLGRVFTCVRSRPVPQLAQATSS
jgi:lipopolysaccharide/colanic/teichoic acid biosynthesis glycosyltransferase